MRNPCRLLIVTRRLNTWILCVTERLLFCILFNCGGLSQVLTNFAEETLATFCYLWTRLCIFDLCSPVRLLVTLFCLLIPVPTGALPPGVPSLVSERSARTKDLRSHNTESSDFSFREICSTRKT